jgi:hypothetical protein
MEEMEVEMAQATLRRPQQKGKTHSRASIKKSTSKKNIKKAFHKKMNIFRKWWHWAAGGALIVLLALTIGMFMYNAKMATSRIIGRHVEEMSDFFAIINEKCGILTFDHDVNYVNFLNVGSFVGSEVGSMNLRNPEGWDGPYVQDNPTVQSKDYEIIKTFKGAYLVPGKGVKLSNGMVIGEDIILDKEADIPALLESGILINKEGKPLAAEVTMSR